MHQELTRHLHHWRRRVIQDLRVLRTLFPWRVGTTLLAAIAVAAFAFQQAYVRTQGLQPGEFSYIKAVYAILNMATFQVSFADLPPGPGLELFFILVPLIGIPLLLALGANLLHILRVFFVRRERGQMWQRALARTVESPIVVCGLGRVGYRVAGELLDMQRPVVGLDRESSPLTESLLSRDLPVVLGDARDEQALISAAVERARTVIVCTHDDLANIEAAFHVRSLNPDARIVLRLFEDEIAGDIQGQFRIESVLSRSAIAAQAFAHSALGVDVLESFRVDGTNYVLAGVSVQPTSPLVGLTIDELAESKRATVVCLHRDRELLIDPPVATSLAAEDKLFLFMDAARLALLTQTLAPHNGTPVPQKPVLVCGIGHTGYRVVRTLQALGEPTIALDLAPGELAERLRKSDVPVIYGDFRRRDVLERAGVHGAEAVVACTEDDMANLATILRAKEAAPDSRFVMRIFEEPLGRQLQQAFGIDAVYSTSALAAPAFVSAALNLHLTQSVSLGDRELLIARITLETLSGLSRDPISRLDREPEVTVLLHRRDNQVHIPPNPHHELRGGDEVVLLATRDKLQEISLRNRGRGRRRSRGARSI